MRLSARLVVPVIVATWAVAAQRAPAAQREPARSVWDAVYTSAQAERGKAAYEQQCALCHLSDLTGQGFAPALVEDTFKSRWEEGNLGDLFTIVKQTMPQDTPASLSDQEYAEIVAYLLKSNGYPAGEQELAPDPAALKGVAFKVSSLSLLSPRARRRAAARPS